MSGVRPRHGDTLLGLMARSFLRQSASHSRCRLARVAATTLARTNRVTIHRYRWRSYLPHIAIHTAAAELLILMPSHMGGIRDVAHIPDRQSTSLAFGRVGDHRLADLVLHVTDTPLLFGTKAVFHLLESPPSARCALAAALARLEVREPFGGLLRSNAPHVLKS